MDLALQLVEDNPFEPCTHHETPKAQLPHNMYTIDDCRTVFNIHKHPDGRIVGIRNDVDKLQVIIDDPTITQSIAHDFLLYRVSMAIKAAHPLSDQTRKDFQDFGSPSDHYFITKFDQALCHSLSTIQAIIVLFVS